MSNETTIEVEYKVPTITCECGQRFVLIGIIELKDEFGQKYDQHWHQNRTKYCPYCGKEHEQKQTSIPN